MQPLVGHSGQSNFFATFYIIGLYNRHYYSYYCRIVAFHYQCYSIAIEVFTPSNHGLDVHAQGKVLHLVFTPIINCRLLLLYTQTKFAQKEKKCTEGQPINKVLTIIINNYKIKSIVYSSTILKTLTSPAGTRTTQAQHSSSHQGKPQPCPHPIKNIIVIFVQSNSKVTSKSLYKGRRFTTSQTIHRET